jgi:hypothetical protein
VAAKKIHYVMEERKKRGLERYDGEDPAQRQR